MKKIVLLICMIATSYIGLYSAAAATATPPVATHLSLQKAREEAFAAFDKDLPIQHETIEAQSLAKQAVLEQIDTTLLERLSQHHANPTQKHATLQENKYAIALQKSGKIGLEKLLSRDGLTLADLETIHSRINQNQYTILAKSILYHATLADIQAVLQQRITRIKILLTLAGGIAATAIDAVQKHNEGKLDQCLANKIVQNIDANTILSACGLMAATSMIGYDNLKAYVLHPMWQKVQDTYRWVKNNPKQSFAGLTFALVSNWFIRGDKSLIGHYQQHGTEGFIPAAGDQLLATSKAMAKIVKSTTHKDTEDATKKPSTPVLPYSTNNADTKTLLQYAAATTGATVATGIGYKGYKAYQKVRDTLQQVPYSKKIKFATLGAIPALIGYKLSEKKSQKHHKSEIYKFEKNAEALEKNIESLEEKYKILEKNHTQQTPWIWNKHNNIKPYYS